MVITLWNYPNRIQVNLLETLAIKEFYWAGVITYSSDTWSEYFNLYYTDFDRWDTFSWYRKKHSGKDCS